MSLGYRLGYFAPLPPAQSGVADYAAAMLQVLQPLAPVCVNAAGDRNVYHVGNNRLHAAIYERCLREPGVVILHDPLLQHLMLGSLDEQAYVEEFVHNSGEWSRDHARQLWQRRGSAMADPVYYRYPMLRRLVEASHAVVVHAEPARDMVLAAVRRAGRDTPVHVLPHLQLDPPQPPYWEDLRQAAARDELRRGQLGLASGEVLLGMFGFLRESKRLQAVLRVVEHLRDQGLPLRLLVAGEFASEDYARATEPLLRQHPWVLRQTRCAAEEFRRLLQAVDVCINLRYPSAGESSGIAARALALGTPLVASEGSGDAALPAGCVVPVATGPAEEASLSQALRWLATDMGARRSIAMEGQRWCREHMDPASICHRLLAIATEALSTARGEGAQSPPC
jgi:glycosyltransferase involved in cell wall biosynthesis